jgi:exodeoxyribonuclease VII small subunit
MKPELTYKEAFAALEKLVGEIEDETVQLDVLAEKIHLANEYIQLCESKLRTIEEEVQQATAQH